MNFTTNKIASKIIGIIDIGSYKIRVGICKFHNGEFELIGYGEKRQDFKHITAIQDFINIKSICENISHAIKKAEDNCRKSIPTFSIIENIVLNIPFEEIFIESNTVNYKRKNYDENIIDNGKIINKYELLNILKYITETSINKHYNKIYNISGYNKEDLRLIIGGITEILADNKSTQTLLKKSPKEIDISILNIFIPESKYEIINSIGRALNKNIIKIIPSEFALTKLFEKKKEIVIIDLGSFYTSIIVKKNNQILGIRKISIGIDSLIKKIKNNHKITYIEIINSIDKNLYNEEKEKFLLIFTNILIITLEEILEKYICPNNFFMTGGGSNNFVKKYLKNINLNKNNLKIAKSIDFIKPEIEFIENSSEEISMNSNYSKSNLNIYAMMVSTLDFIKKENDPIEKSLKEIL